VRQLNIKRLIVDLGGVSNTSLMLGISRTTPYRWIAQGHMSSRILDQIKTKYPKINLNKYYEVIDEQS